MACFSPLKGYRDSSGSIVFSERGRIEAEVTVPCGMCVGCRIARQRMWALRIVHESKLHDRNCFVTLTYDDANLPSDGSLHYPDVQSFHKRLRHDGPFRFFCVGEYGEELSRPHYHVCYFGMFPPDATRLRSLADEQFATFDSKRLVQLWGKGHVHVGELTYASASYAAGYIFKKKLGQSGKTGYDVVDEDGVVSRRVPEFARMSNRPGIGHDWYMRHRDDFHVWDKAVQDGRVFPVPKYYDRLLERVDPDRLSRLREDREVTAYKGHSDNRPERLVVKADVATARIRHFDSRMKK